MKLYSTVKGPGEAEMIVEKSRFITHVLPVESKEEADEFILTIKKKYKDATHNVPAMVLGDKFQIQWASDDGEPQGTSGAPIVQMLVNMGVTNVVLVVTRYFGGIKLGTGGLVRAYTNAAKAGLDAAEICDIKEASVLEYQVDYSVFNKIQNYPFTFSVTFGNMIYADNVRFDIVTDPDNVASLKEAIEGLSLGQAELLNESVRLEKF